MAATISIKTWELIKNLQNTTAIPLLLLLLLLLLLRLYLFTLTPSAIADFQGGRDNKKKTIYINTNKDSKTQVRC